MKEQEDAGDVLKKEQLLTYLLHHIEEEIIEFI